MSGMRRVRRRAFFESEKNENRAPVCAAGKSSAGKRQKAPGKRSAKLSAEKFSVLAAKSRKVPGKISRFFAYRYLFLFFIVLQ